MHNRHDREVAVLHVGARLISSVGALVVGGLIQVELTAATVAGEAPDPAVEAGRAALDSWWDYGWYDDDRDGLRRVRIPAPSQPSGGSNFDAGFGELFQVLGWMLLVAILVAMAYLLARAYLERETAALERGLTMGDRSSRQLLDRVEALPAEVRRETSDLLAAARQQVRDGNYSEAIIYLFSHLLVVFDQSDLLRLSKGKTNRQYLREVRRSSREQPLLAPAFGDVMHAFEDVYYGKHELTRSRFEACWSTLPQIHAELARIEQEAAA